MKSKLLTDVELRARWSQDRSDTYCVDADVILTPAAADFIREHGITLCRKEQKNSETMTRTTIPMRDGKPVYLDAQSGRETTCKGEGMTHLRGNLLVPKTHPQIAFRGQLDTMMAMIMQVQIVAQEQGQSRIVTDLQELLEFSHKILAAEVKDEPLAEVAMLGMDSQQIRYNSQQVKKVFGIDHPIPSYKMGKLCVELNRLRTQIREVELGAAQAFYCGGSFSRPDIIEALNRMSSCVYILMCRKLSGFYDRGNRL
jgi:ethanolamine utilization cobalamin adenosyltransferase